MELRILTGEKTENAGTLLKDASQPEKKKDLHMLEQIDGQPGLLLDDGKTETEG